tara:strand:- start:883 stop:1026 length:144 start_codon:yes stop_codon:yes gene_type:complete
MTRETKRSSPLVDPTQWAFARLLGLYAPGHRGAALSGFGGGSQNGAP